MGNENHDFTPSDPGDPAAEPQAGPSWQRRGWPLVGGETEDELTQALDPTAMQIKVKEALEKAGKPADARSVEAAASDALRAMLLVRLYRVRGHLAADLDPLGLTTHELPKDLTLEWHEFAGQEDKEVFLAGNLGFEWVTIGELLRTLQANYCGRIGLEYMHIADVEERRFLQDKFEGKDKEIEFTPEGKRAILSAVVRGEQFEEFLAKKYVGTKRFGLDGGESMIPALEAVIKYGGAYGVNEIVYGMAHRGRLNVLSNVMGKPYRVIFHEFSGGSATPDEVGGSGDVKYHLGTSTDRGFDDIEVHMSLVPNPSHLEAVDPVVLGKVRAQQAIRDDLVKHQQVLPVLIHGDAAFAGQGIVWECLGFSGVRGYNTGGCIHFVINNQIGFTTSPQFARSSPYPSDVAKGVQAPILHVNGDDPEAVTFACKLAIEYRQKFGRDIVIDMWCYRRFGHNEGDEPSFTQPLMYAKIKQHPKVSDIYARRLVEEGVIDEDFLKEDEAAFTAKLADEFEAGQNYTPDTSPPIPRPRAATSIPGSRASCSTASAARSPPCQTTSTSTARSAACSMPSARCSKAAKVSTGPPPRRSPSARCCPKASACACRARTRAAAPSASGMRSGSTRRTSGSTSRWRPCRTAISPCSTARSPNTACSASNTAMRWPIRNRWSCGKRSSVISPMARRS